MQPDGRGPFEHRAETVVGIEGFLPLDEVFHVDFDGDKDGLLWVYRFGRSPGGEESQLFRVDCRSVSYRVIALPEMLQKLPFSCLRVRHRTLFLLGGRRSDGRVPSGFAIDEKGRILAAFHFRFALRDALVPAQGGLFLLQDDPRETQDPVLFLTHHEDEHHGKTAAGADPAVQWTCLGERGLLGGLDGNGKTQYVRLGPPRRNPISGPQCGAPKAVGWSAVGEVMSLGQDGRIWRQWGETAVPLRLLDSQGQEVSSIALARFRYRRLYVLHPHGRTILSYAL